MYFICNWRVLYLNVNVTVAGATVSSSHALVVAVRRKNRGSLEDCRRQEIEFVQFVQILTARRECSLLASMSMSNCGFFEIQLLIPCCSTRRSLPTTSCTELQKI